ncbi:MAG: adenosine deaminase [Leptospira sp.]|nr:adenosine deaminase [Leptospira sp.]
MYCDLHNHLYGCLPAETLFRIGKENPEPRWHIYVDAFEKAYGIKTQPKSFFEDYADIKKFKSLYHFKEKAPFLNFQAKFNLIIALIQFHEKEIREISRDVVLSHALTDVSYAEYRLMFSKDELPDAYYRKLIACCEGLAEGEAKAKSEGKFIEARLVMSIHRDLYFERHYDWMKNWMVKDTFLRKYLVGIDFCHIEEGFPPKDKKHFFNQIIKDNKAETSTALSILYHVGESFRDKSPFSAVRWIWESAENGAHRLGHALALGISPDFFLAEERTELVSERLDQIHFDLENYDSILEFGSYFSKEDLNVERNLLKTKVNNDQITMMMDSIKIRYLQTFQNFIMSKIAQTNSIIECCPSSNLYIGMLENLADHPIARFYDNNIKITIGSDDPGLFDTNLKREYEKAHESGLDEKSLSEIQRNSFLYTSPILSGREIIDLNQGQVN